mmetsp:Transcript_14298/g.42657  ORF Transcript_14298/g.42657 Transcript_14298/m.42657 type:complete len:236 (-) Transcript_14298:19-726(-)
MVKMGKRRAPPPEEEESGSDADDSDAFSEESEDEAGLDEYGRRIIPDDYGEDGDDSSDDGAGAAKAPGALADSSDDEAEYNAVLAEMDAQRRIQGMEDEDEDEDESDAASFHSVEERVSKKGRTVFHVTLCPDVAPFTTREAADEFMKGREYRRTLKRELRAVKAARKGLAEAALSDEQKAKREAKRAAKREARHEQKKAAKKARALSADQIAARKAKFQRKKARRLARREGKGA